MMEKFHFQVSARAGKLLGRENFSNAEGALIELVKNSYDADAKNCLVIFDIRYKTVLDSANKETIVPDNENSQIFILDNGEGMTSQVIQEQWMLIGTGNKEANYLSSEKRVRTGAKGIGRFALDRLGFFSEMWTIPKTSKDRAGSNWKMDLSQFDDSSKSISEITAEHSNLRLRLEEVLKKNGLKCDELDKYQKKTQHASGTLLRISNLKDDWFEEDIASVFRNLEALIPPKELAIPFQVDLLDTRRPSEFGKVETAFFNDFDYKVVANYDSKKLQMSMEITRNELDLEVVERDYASIFKNAKYPLDFATLKKKKFKQEKPIQDFYKSVLTEDFKKQLTELGSFHFTFYYLKLTNSEKEGYPYKSISSKERRSVLDRFGGVKIYRDSFRVRPYGDPGNDWLRLGTRASQSPAGAGQRVGDWRVRPESTAGIISISRKGNPLLVDKSDRGSLVENDTMELFSQLVTKVIHEFEIDRTRILNPFYIEQQKKKEADKQAEIELRAQQLADQMVKKRQEIQAEFFGKKPKSKTLFDEKIEQKEREAYEKAAKETFKNIEQLAAEAHLQEIAQVRALASLGLIVSSFAHELKEVRNNSSEIKDLEKIYKKLIPEELRKSSDYTDGVDILELLKNNSEKIRHWVDYSLTAIKRDKRQRMSLNFSIYFSGLANRWKKLLDSRKIELKLIDLLDGQVYDFRAFEMDMDTIFSNLITNSIDSFNALKEVRKRVITIEVSRFESEIVVVYSDNGIGLSNLYPKKEEIFLPFITSKKDRKGNPIGTGLGMYLVKNVVGDNNASINLMDSQIGFCTKISFPLRK